MANISTANFSNLITRTNELIASFENLTTFEKASQWDADAQGVIASLEQEKASFTELKTEEQEALNLARKERESQPFFQRLLASKDTENTHAENIKIIDQVNANANLAIEKLFELIDKTPNSKAEQKEMLDEMKQYKKELTLEKRSVSENVRLINTEARKKTASVSGTTAKLLYGSSARYMRSSVRYQKESTLKPQEDAKAAINRQLLELDKNILWVSRFKSEEKVEVEEILHFSGYETPGDPVEPKVLRCAFCGRKVTEGSPCEGCGSDHTKLELN